MKKIIFTTVTVAAMALIVSCGSKPETVYPADIVPLPVSVKVNPGGFPIKASTMITVPEDHADLAVQARLFAGYLEPVIGREMEVATGKGRKGAVNLAIDPALGSEEYRIEATSRRIDVAGGSEAGVLYGLQTLRQLVQPAAEGSADHIIPAVEITDKPSFEYRGMHLDVSRHFFPVDDVKSYIDILALHKINRFHWHLTDDQGWRIEIKSRPKLTEVGSIRARTWVGPEHPPKTYDETPYGGYYTQEEAREIVRYAAERCITVIPEIEMPGHAVAALASYPEIGCTGGPYKVWDMRGVTDDIFCAGNELTFEILEDVLTEIIDIFPSEYINLGGDEAPKIRWEACPKCQARIKAEGLKDAHQLQGYFMTRMENFLKEHGRKMIGWDEILEGGVSPDATLLFWRTWAGEKWAKTVADSGNRIIMSPTEYCYFDYYQGPAETEPLAFWGSYLPLSKVYEFDPYEYIAPESRANVWGVQANLWTEFVATIEHAQYMLLPRLAALSETGWAYERKDYGSFLKRMGNMTSVYDRHGYNYKSIDNSQSEHK
jgi:hexosaminidase